MRFLLLLVVCAFGCEPEQEPINSAERKTRDEFVKAMGLESFQCDSTVAHGWDFMRCQGMTPGGVPVTFKCSEFRCWWVR